MRSHRHKILEVVYIYIAYYSASGLQGSVTVYQFSRLSFTYDLGLLYISIIPRSATVYAFLLQESTILRVYYPKNIQL